MKRLALIAGAIILTSPSLYGSQSPQAPAAAPAPVTMETSKEVETVQPVKKSGVGMTPGKRVANFIAGTGCALATIAVGFGLVSAWKPLHKHAAKKFADGWQLNTARTVFLITGAAATYGAYSLFIKNMKRFFGRAFGDAPVAQAAQ